MKGSMGRLFLHFALAALLAAPSAIAQSRQAPELLDIDGENHGRLDSARNAASILYFLMTDCPVSNQYSPEINRICADYKDQGVACYLVFVDPAVVPSAVREHAKDYDLDGYPAIIDNDRRLVELSGATITPEAALFSATGEVLYRGRINDLYAALGKPRRQARVHDLRNALDDVLAGRPVSRRITKPVGCYIPPNVGTLSR